MWQLSYQHALKILIKIGKSFCIHFNIKDRRNLATYLAYYFTFLYYFKKGKNTTEMQTKIWAVCGEGAMADQTYQKRFAKFCAGDFLLVNTPWLSRPVEVDRDQIETLIEINQCYTTWEIANMLKISKSSIEKHLREPRWQRR